MTTITTDGSTSVGGPRRVAYDSNGNIWAMIYNATAGDWEFWWSADLGATWTENTSLALTPGSTPNAGAFAINRNGDVAVCYTDGTGTQTANFINGLTTTSSAWTTVASTSVSAVRDVVTFAKPGSSNWYIAPVAATNVQVYEVTSAGVYVGAALAPTAGAGVGVSIDVNHTGDGGIAPSPHLHVAYTSGGNAVYRKFSWTGTGWSTGSARTLGAATGTLTAGAFDGSRFVVAAGGSTAGTVRVWQRDAADTTTTDLGTTADIGTGVFATPIVAIDQVTQDVYIVGSDSVGEDVDYTRWTRATNTWDGSWTAIADTITIEGINCLTASKSQPSSRIAVVWDQQTGDTVHGSISYNTGPTAPTWVTPVDGSAYDEGATLACSWTFNDPNAGDTQSAYALKRTISASTTYYRASDSSWQATEQKNTSTTNGVTLPATWGADGESVTLSVKTWDQDDVEGIAYSSTITVLGSTPVTPVLSAPTDAGTIATNQVTVTWSASEQTAYRVRLLTSADAVLYDSGKVTSTDVTLTPATILADGLTAAKAEVRVWNDDDLVGATDTHTFTVDFVEPATPTYVVTAVPSSGRTTVAIHRPDPTGGQPTVTSHDVYVRVASGGRADLERPVDPSEGVRIATGVAAPTLAGAWNLTVGSGNANNSGVAVYLGGSLFLNDTDADAVDRSSALAAVAVGDVFYVGAWEFTITAATDNTSHWEFAGTSAGTVPSNGEIAITDAAYRDYAAGSGIAYEYRTLAKADNLTSIYGAWT